jgi:hypothetical protein
MSTATTVALVEVGPEAWRGFVVTVETERGDLLRFPTAFSSAAAAERFAARVRGAGVIVLDRWDYVRAIYGSAAYFEDGCELDQLEREWEADGRPAFHF